MTVVTRQQDKKYFTFGIGAMLLVVLLLGIRSMKTVKVVLDDKTSYVEAGVEHPRLVKEALLGVTARDSLVEVSLLDASLRDPFKRLSTVAAPRKMTRAPRQAIRIVEPLLAALIFDDVNPTVQISVGSERSDWLQTGDLFQGWQVAEIDSKSVKVKKGDKEIVLH